MFPERLTQGYRAFLDGRFAGERSRYETLAPGFSDYHAASMKAYATRLSD